MTNEASKAHETQGPTAGDVGPSEAGQGPGMAVQEAVTTLLSVARALSLALDGLADQASRSLVGPADVDAVQRLAWVIVKGLLYIKRGEADVFTRGNHAWALRQPPEPTAGG